MPVGESILHRIRKPPFDYYMCCPGCRFSSIVSLSKGDVELTVYSFSELCIPENKDMPLVGSAIKTCMDYMNSVSCLACSLKITIMGNLAMGL